VSLTHFPPGLLSTLDSLEFARQSIRHQKKK
jgi:hypothetical protein